MKTLTMRAFATFLFATVLMAAPLRVQAQSATGTVVTMSGFFSKGVDNEPTEAAYALYDSKGKKIGQTLRSSAKEGYLVTGLKPGETYIIRAEDPRFFRQEWTIDIPATSKYLEISRDFQLYVLEVGRKVKVLPSPFDAKKTTLKPGTEDALAKTARLFVMNPNANLELICYPDAEGSADAAQKFSSARAETVKAFLVSKGVSADRISIRAVSTVDPLDPPPIRASAKGKRYVGAVYIAVTKI